jgi:hypothetical protein
MDMKPFCPKPALLLALLAAAFVAGCSGIPQDGRYQSGGRGGGWENFRAEAPSTVRTT